MAFTPRLIAPAGAFALAISAFPTLAHDSAEEEEPISDESVGPSALQGPQTSDGPPAGPPAGLLGFKPVFDDTWVTIGIGAGLVPSYSGSDNYRVFPLPLITGRVAGIGISPNGPGFNLNLLSEAQSPTPSKTSFSFGPSFRFRNDRANQIQDDVVELATELDTAIELGVNGGVSFTGVFNPRDRLSLNAQVRWDVLDAHNGMLIEPGISYFRPLDAGTILQVSANVSFVDDDYADYYYTVAPADAAATGLAEFTADGGLDSVGALAILTFDLDGNALNGGFNIYTVAGYTRLVGDGADTPFTSERGSANQLIGGIGVGYTF